ncbi:MAG: glycosyltransferase family 4 protein [Leptolyngbya sp. SIO3F4]|nr:glycosyltransferase family 4 protein [Leptolyngbya sp. SIO3F4]
MAYIHHCVTSLDRQGGAQTYIHSLLKHQSSDVNQQVINLFDGVKQNQFKLLHIHDPKQLTELSGECPVVFTLHNHSTYCPSGSRFLSASQSCCNRPVSYLGCTWGHLVEGCGSRRPEKIFQGFRVSQTELKNLKNKKIPIIAVSNYARHQLIRQGISQDQVTTVHHGITSPGDLSEPLTAEIHSNQRILFVGRLVPEKGLSILIRALAQTLPHIHLDIAGEGWMKPQLQTLAKQLSLEKRITWHGWCDSQKLEKLYQTCYAVIFPSLWPEPAGLITLEAYARFRPIIASNVGGIPEYIIPGKTGLLVPPNSTVHLVEAISKLSTDLDLCQRLASQGHTHYQNSFTIGHHVKSLEKIYESVIQGFSNNTSKPI